MEEIEIRLRAGAGVLERRANRDVAGTLDRMIRDGRLRVLHPGVYCLPDQRDDPLVRIRAAMAWAGPDAVLTGWAAAKVTFWPSLATVEIGVALPRTTKRSALGVRFERRSIPPELTAACGGLRVSRACLTAVDLAVTRKGGEVIDRVLRTRTATLAQMWNALRMTPNRPGNVQRARLLAESRTEPWSEAEREAHRLLGGAGIVGWVANALIASYFVDILFAHERVIVEIDGWEAHGTRAAFEADRKRRNHLQLMGYLVLNFTWWQLVNESEWVLRCVRAAIGR